MLRMDAFKNGVFHGAHYVFVTGELTNEWVVVDPGWRVATPAANLLTIQGHLDGFQTGSTLREFDIGEARIFSQGKVTSSLTVTAHSPVDLLVTGPDGGRVGYHGKNGSYLFEIPQASYLVDPPLLDASGGPSVGDPTEMKTVYIPTPGKGNYSIETLGTGPGSYTLVTELESGFLSQTVTNFDVTDVGATNLFTTSVPTLPVTLTCSIEGDNAVLSFVPQGGTTNTIEYSVTLLSPDWKVLQSVTGTGIKTTFTDTNGVSSSHFYRVRTE